MSILDDLKNELLHTRTLTCISKGFPDFMGVTALYPSKLVGSEGINTLFNYELELRSHLALAGTETIFNYDLNTMLGREISTSIQLDGKGALWAGETGLGKGVRQINGVITQARYLREENRQAVYSVTIQPWLYFATLRSDCRIFQNQTVVDVIDKVLSHYPYSTKKLVVETYPSIDCFTQYNETDFAFVERLCREYGINYFFEHRDGVHHLVLADHNGIFQENNSVAYRDISFYPDSLKIDEEHISQFSVASQITTGSYCTTDYDYTKPRSNLTVVESDPRNTGQASEQIYVYHNAPAINHTQPNAGAQSANGDDLSRGQAIAKVRMQALRQVGLRSQGSGNLRAVVPGTSFKLHHHPRDGVTNKEANANANVEYIVLHTHLSIEDIGQTTQRPNANPIRSEQWRVQTYFTVQASTEILRPDIIGIDARPRAYGVESALVVGPSDDTAASNIYTDYLGRIKIQFHWDRIGKSDQTSSIWVHMDAPWAGNQLGITFVPRIGEEVLVSFEGGDIDKPIVTSRLYNQNNQPPWQLPSQQALSGFRSRELVDSGGNSSGGRSNHLILDDTDKKIQIQAKSDHQSSSLSLGFITRIDNNSGRQDARGEGFELRTDAKGVMRAKEGLLLTTEARSNASAHFLDMTETTQRLSQAQEDHADLGSNAQQCEAQDENNNQGQVSKILETQQQAIKGSQGGSGTSSAPSSSQGNEDKKFPELSEPHIVLASPAGIASTTPHTTSIHSGEHIALTSGKHTSISSAKNLLASVSQKISLFSEKLGMKFISQEDMIEMKALKHSINLSAKLGINVTANKVTLQATKSITINGGGSYTTWNKGGITHHTSGAHTVYKAGLDTPGPKSFGVNLGDMGKAGPFEQTFLLYSAEGNNIKTSKIILYSEEKELFNGSSSSGKTTPINKNNWERYAALAGIPDKWEFVFFDESKVNEDSETKFILSESCEERDIEML